MDATAEAHEPPTRSRPARSGKSTRRFEAALLAPGASAGRDQPGLVAIDAALSRAGVVVERLDFPYWLAGRKRPDPPAVLLASLEQAARELAERSGLPKEAVALGGRSMGGRIASMAVAEGFPAAALLLVSYPLHPPGRPEKLRTEHFRRIAVPCLFVSGTRDAFGKPDELEAATRSIRGPVTHVWLEGGDHSLRRLEDEVARTVLAWATGSDAS